jgi:DNA-binding IclR family transcriptional regulator
MSDERPATVAPRRRGRPRTSDSIETVRSVRWAFDILDLVGSNGHGLTFADITATLVVPAVTTHRILATMTGTAYLRLDESTGRYYLGPAITRITNDVLAMRTRFRDLGQTYLHELVERTGETANLAILDGLEAAYLDQVHTSRMLRAQTYLRVPLDCSGTGKVLLAFQTDSVREAILRRLTLQRCTPNSSRSLAELRRRLATIRDTGIGYDDEEMELGVRCIAAPVTVTGTIVAAISIAGPATRVSHECLDDLSAIVRDVAAKFSQAVTVELPNLGVASLSGNNLPTIDGR